MKQYTINSTKWPNQPQPRPPENPHHPLQTNHRVRPPPHRRNHSSADGNIKYTANGLQIGHRWWKPKATWTMTTILRRGDTMGKALEGKQRRRGGLDYIEWIVWLVLIYLFCWVGLLDGSVGVYEFTSPRPHDIRRLTTFRKRESSKRTGFSKTVRKWEDIVRNFYSFNNQRYVLYDAAKIIYI